MADLRLLKRTGLAAVFTLLLASCYKSPFTGEAADGGSREGSGNETRVGIGAGTAVEQDGGRSDSGFGEPSPLSGLDGELPADGSDRSAEAPSSDGLHGTTTSSAAGGGEDGGDMTAPAGKGGELAPADTDETGTDGANSSTPVGGEDSGQSGGTKGQDSPKTGSGKNGDSGNPGNGGSSGGGGHSTGSGKGDGSGNSGGRYPSSVKSWQFHPGYYMSVGTTDSILAFRVIENNPNFIGVKKRYTWRALEPQKGQYDFSEIVSDLKYLESIGKHLWISVNITTFAADSPPMVPSYMWNDSKYGCGDNGEFYGAYRRTLQEGGWLPCRGNSDFDKRFKALMAALGKRFNDEPYFEGLNLGETSTGKRPDKLSADKKLQVFKEYALAAKRAFPNKTVMQMINYAPFDLEAFGEWLAAHGIATGGPDVHVRRADTGSLGTAYAIHKKNHWKTPNGIDVQWDNWNNGGKTYTSLQLLETAVEYINPWYMFWTKKPGVFKEDVVPAVRKYGPLPAVRQLDSSG